MCNCTTEQSFAWVGAIVVNAAFISFIAWGASTIWWVGFAISIVYTLILWFLASFIDRKSGWDRQEDGEGDGSLHDETELRMTPNVRADFVASTGTGRASSRSISGISPHPDERSMPILPNLLYGLVCLALGMTGLFLPVNIFYCPGDRSGPFRPSGHWVTNLTSLPPDVRDWATSVDHYNNYASFVFVPGSKVTLFQGRSDDGSSPNHGQGLWAAPASVYPFASAAPTQLFGIENPSQFVLPSNNIACFTAFRRETVPTPAPNGNKPVPVPIPKSAGTVIGCSDGKTVTTTNMYPINVTLQNPHDFFVANSSATLWFKDYTPYNMPGVPGADVLISSIEDFDTMNIQLHSSYEAAHGYSPPDNNSNNGDNDCWKQREELERKRSIMALLVSSLPILIVSISLWLKRQAPSMAVTTYAGLSSLATFLFIAIKGESSSMDTFADWWYSISGALWMVAMTDLSFSKRRIPERPLVWGVNIGALAFFIGMILLTDIFVGGEPWRWIVFNVFAIVPLGIFGLGTKQVFLLVLCAIGWLMDSFRFASLLAEGSPAEAPIYFVVLGISGLLIAGAGWLLSKYQDVVYDVLVSYLQVLSLSRRIFPAESGHVALQTEDDPLAEPIAPSGHVGDEEC